MNNWSWRLSWNSPRSETLWAPKCWKVSQWRPGHLYSVCLIGICFVPDLPDDTSSRSLSKYRELKPPTYLLKAKTLPLISTGPYPNKLLATLIRTAVKSLIISDRQRSECPFVYKRFYLNGVVSKKYLSVYSSCGRVTIIMEFCALSRTKQFSRFLIIQY